ncbi:hypothetical protein [uncultured Polaribacter sp.]|uniref:hypothetical protein n=1 Tax=uncultured Polaribacter sp. TaxID=174711 RepID=UPI00262FA65C|nr:hypothetical protein [uncultured Polaribacter sp.]
MNCIWCNIKTSSSKSDKGKREYANNEHIFPAHLYKNSELKRPSLFLKQGKVCEACNNRLGHIDKSLKYRDNMMLKKFQDANQIFNEPPGRKGKKRDRKRKLEESTEIRHHNNSTVVKREGSSTSFINPTFFKYDEKFSKAIHKCAVNVLYNELEYDYMKSHFSKLIEFVNSSENNFSEWSFAVCFSNPNSNSYFEPACFQKIIINDVIVALALLLPSAIYLVGTKPNLINVDFLKNNASGFRDFIDWDDENFKLSECFLESPYFAKKSFKTFGEKVKYSLIKKEIKGKPNPKDSFYLLVKCKTCGQTNPTGVMLPKKSALDKINGLSSGNKNSWNFHSKEDLDILCPNVKFSESFVKDFELKYGINYTPENDVKKMNISNCKAQCINCNDLIIYEAKDCFL